MGLYIAELSGLLILVIKKKKEFYH